MNQTRSSAALGLKVYLAALLAAVPSSYLASEIYAWVAPADLPLGLRVSGWVLALAMLYVATLLAGRAVGQILRLQTRRLNMGQAEPRRVLAYFLSPVRTKAVAGEAEPLSAVLPSEPRLSWDLDADLLALAEYKHQRTLANQPIVFWTWEQPLRGIQHNWRGGKLERLILICSRESIQQAHWFGQILQRYEVSNTVRTELLVPDGHGSRLLEVGDQPLDEHFGWNFDDFDEMWRAMSQMLELLGGEGIADREIALDLTGGTKPATVVAASATIHRELRNQYVCTNPKNAEAAVWEYEVLDYDLVVGSSAAWS